MIKKVEPNSKIPLEASTPNRNEVNPSLKDLSNKTKDAFYSRMSWLNVGIPHKYENSRTGNASKVNSLINRIKVG